MWEAFTLFMIFGALVTAGLLFVNHSLYKDFEGKDPVVQVVVCGNSALIIPYTKRLTSPNAPQGLFAVVFALSVNLLLLILSEILGVLSHRSAGSKHDNTCSHALSENLASSNRTRLITWRANVLLLLTIILAALPYYQCYKALSQIRKRQAKSRSACTHASLCTAHLLCCHCCASLL